MVCVSSSFPRREDILAVILGQLCAVLLIIRSPVLLFKGSDLPHKWIAKNLLVSQLPVVLIDKDQVAIFPVDAGALRWSAAFGGVS